MDKKIMIGILILFLFIGVAVMFAVPPAPEPAPAPEEPAPTPADHETKTFENEYVTFQYPKDWVIAGGETNNRKFSVKFNTPEGDVYLSFGIEEGKYTTTILQPTETEPETEELLRTVRLK